MKNILSEDIFERATRIVEEIAWLKKNRFTPGLNQLVAESNDSPALSELLRDLLRRFSYVNVDETIDMCEEMRNFAIEKWDATPRDWIIAGIAESERSDGCMLLIRQLELAFGRAWSPSIYACIGPIFKFQKTKIILVDDFVGSGDKLGKKINRVIKNAKEKNIKLDLRVLAFAGMENGINHLKRILGDSNVFCAKILQRGISDAYTGRALDEAIGAMLDFESKVVPPAPFPKKDRYRSYNFGYEASESLYFWEINPNMSNNVFPIFWWEQLWVMRDYLLNATRSEIGDENSKNRATLFRRV